MDSVSRRTRPVATLDRAAGPAGPGTPSSRAGWRRRTAPQVLVELRPVREDPRADLVERLDRGAFGVGLGLDHHRGDSAGGNELGHPALAVAGGVAQDLSAAG